MRVLFFCHFWPPYHFAGSEIMGQNILRHLRDAGHETLVVTTHEFHAPETWEHDGTKCVRPRSDKTAYALTVDFKPDVILTHHGESRTATTYARHLRIPIVQVIHNDMTYSDDNLSVGTDLAIYNTHYIQDKYTALFNYPSTVLHPPVYADEHRAERREGNITLVNLNIDKGSRQFYDLADRMPEYTFLAVEGGHGGQVFEAHKNVRHQPQTMNMRDDVWARTAVLLVPSIYESYGMVGVEALASGIPVIAHPTFGLKESLGDAGIFIDRDHPHELERELRALMTDSDYYSERCKISLKRSSEIEDSREQELQATTEALERLVEEWPTQPHKTSPHAWVVS